MSMDDEFKARALAAEQAEIERAANRGSGGFNKTYEDIKWTGLEKGIMKIVRALGSEPNFSMDDARTYFDNPNMTAYDARVMRIATLRDDKGKKMRLVMPFECVDENFILWRLIRKVNEYEWVDKKRVYTNLINNPAVYNIINFNGLPEDDKSRQFGLEGYGWKGREVFVMNCIDRAMYQWHRDNKHSALLSKKIEVRKNLEGKENVFTEEGVPAYGFTSKIQIGLTKFYGSWENFDIGIEKTGTQAEPTRCINASRLLEQVPAKLQSLVSGDPLTEEEKSWARYDLNKLCGVSSYSKIYNKLHLTIAQIDKALGTNYSEELRVLAENEKAEFKARGTAEPEDADTAAPLSQSGRVSAAGADGLTASKTVEDEPVRAVSTITTSSTATGFSTVQLPAYDKLTETEKSFIKSATKTADGKFEIEYSGGGKIFKCPDCKTKSPESFKTCPGCGMNLGTF
jgi:hypothetical protein